MPLVHVGGGPDRDSIDEIHVWMAKSQDGKLGVIALLRDMGLGTPVFMPLLSSDRDVAERLRDNALDQAARQQSVDVELVTFVRSESGK